MEDAQRILAALEVLSAPHSSPSEITGADVYLREVRASRAIWDIGGEVVRGEVAALRQPMALHFICLAIEEQIRLFWERMSAEERMGAFNLCLSLVESAAASKVPMAIDCACRATSVCVARVDSSERNSVWQSAMARARVAVVQCEMLGALIQEWDSRGPASAAREKERREFAQEKCAHAVGETSAVLSKPESSEAQKLAAVRCLRLWRPHAPRGSLIDVLSRAVLDPVLCEAAGETLEDELSEGEVGASALVRMCEAFKAVLNEAGMVGIQAHVIALTCAAAAEANIDSMLSDSSADRVEAAATLISLLQTCLKSQRKSVATAAVDGWSALSASAAALRDETNSVQIITEQLPTAIEVMTALARLPGSGDTAFWHDELLVDEAMNMRTVLRDALLQTSIALGCDRFILVLMPLIRQMDTENMLSKSPESFESIIFAVAAGGDSLQSSRGHQQLVENLMQILTVICRPAVSSMLTPQLGKSTMQLIENYAQIFPLSEPLFTLGMQAVAAVLPIDSDSAASALASLAHVAPRHIVPHCDGLLLMLKKDIDALSTSATVHIVQALAAAASELPSREAQMAAIDAIVAPLSSRITALASQERDLSARARLSSALSTLAAAIHAFNNPHAAGRLLRDLSGEISHIMATSVASDDYALVDSLCAVLEAGVAGGISDEESKQEPPDQELVKAVLQLATDAFLSSGCSEARWLRVLRGAVLTCDIATEGGFQALNQALGRSLIGLRKVLTEENPNLRPDVIEGYTGVLNTCLTQKPRILVEHGQAMTDIALIALQVNMPSPKGLDIFRWWKSFLYIADFLKPYLASFLQAQGTDLVRYLFLCMPQATSRRRDAAISDVLLAFLANASSQFDPNAAIVTALRTDGIPVPWMVSEEKQQVERCFQHVISQGNKHKFKAFVSDFSSYCRHENTFDVFLAYQM